MTTVEVCIELNAPDWAHCIDYRDKVRGQSIRTGLAGHPFSRNILRGDHPVVDLQWTVDDSRVAAVVAALRAEFDVRQVHVVGDDEIDSWMDEFVVTEHDEQGRPTRRERKPT